MDLKKALVRSVAGLSAAAVPLLMSAQPAGADEGYSRSRTIEHTFTTSGGRRVTCTIFGGSDLFRFTGERSFFASAVTEAYGDDPACSTNFVTVFATYRDANGQDKSSGAAGQGFVEWVADDASRDFQVEHFAAFFDCEANCDAFFTTRPK